jgi:hypothetical protein
LQRVLRDGLGEQGRTPRRLGTERQQCAWQAADQVGFGTCRGKRKANAACGFDDTGSDFQEAKTQRHELGCGQFPGFGNRVAHRQLQPISGGVENEADLIGGRRTAAGAIGGELRLMQLDQIFGLASRAIQAVVGPLGLADIVSAEFLDRQSFVSGLSAAAKRNARSKVLVFVHGFNNRFDRAVYRFAQINHDSRAPAVPVLFSWPSRGAPGLRAYQEDLESANAASDAADQLLDTIGKNANVQEVTVLCHSVGCSPNLEALHAKVLRAGKIGNKIKNVMLVAPDLDADLFRTQMREMGSARPCFALFVSQDDIAFKLSGSIRGGTSRAARLPPIPISRSCRQTSRQLSHGVFAHGHIPVPVRGYTNVIQQTSTAISR